MLDILSFYEKSAIYVDTFVIQSKVCDLCHFNYLFVDGLFAWQNLLYELKNLIEFHFH